MPESTERGALTEAVFSILLTLLKPTHGYGIMKYVGEISKGRVVLGSGTLYGAINTLLKKQWIEVVETDSDKKKQYKTTPTGTHILKKEIARLEELVETGNKVLGGWNNEK